MKVPHRPRRANTETGVREREYEMRNELCVPNRAVNCAVSQIWFNFQTGDLGGCSFHSSGHSSFAHTNFKLKTREHMQGGRTKEGQHSNRQREHALRGTLARLKNWLSGFLPWTIGIEVLLGHHFPEAVVCHFYLLSGTVLLSGFTQELSWGLFIFKCR